jgi:putative glutamine amidotransferase
MSATPRPLLGVIACQRRIGTDPVQAVANRYLEAAMAYADVAAVMLPSLPALVSARELAPRIDGLLLTGSASNIEPARYGEPDAADAAGPFDPGRDEMTAALVETMVDLGKPVFGICRGLQELNVIFGGDLRRDTSASPDLLAHHAPDEADFAEMFEHLHEVRLEPGGRLHEAFGRSVLKVNSVHFQGIGRLAAPLRVEARAPDGVIEAVSAEIGHAPVLAVQWHPEWRAAENPDSQTFFRLLGRALRGERVSDVRT